MAQPLLARLREKLPGAEIDLLAPEWVASVARRMPEVSEVIAAPFRHGALQLRERWKLGRALRAGQALAILQRARAVPRHRGRSPGFAQRPRVGRRHSWKQSHRQDDAR